MVSHPAALTNAGSRSGCPSVQRESPVSSTLPWGTTGREEALWRRAAPHNSVKPGQRRQLSPFFLPLSLLSSCPRPYVHDIYEYYVRYLIQLSNLIYGDLRFLTAAVSVCTSSQAVIMGRGGGEGEEGWVGEEGVGEEDYI